MMIEPIKKQRKLPQSQDYAFLRRTGLDYIRQFASELWTDHNVHDPGITTLEVLCYAITELGYRAGFDIKDILAAPPDKDADKQTKDFFTASEILTCNPVTILDFRKLLIDREGVRNAWLHSTYNRPEGNKSADPAFYYKCSGEDASYTIKLDSNDGDFTGKYLNGLYNVSLQLEEYGDLGDLSSNVIPWRVKRANGPEVVDADIVLPPFEVLFPCWDNPILQLDSSCSLTGAAIDGSHESNGVITFDLELKFKPEDTGATDDLTIVIRGIKVLTSPEAGFVLDSEDIIPLIENTGHDSLTLLLFNRLKKIISIFCDVYRTLHSYRNLCEDYVKLRIVRAREIKLCADVELAENADPEVVLAKIYYLVDRFLAPPVRFYSLIHMLGEKKKTVDEIYQGTIPEHGFIDEEELKLSELKSELHVSDIHRIIMSIDGVRHIDKLQLSDYLDGIAQTDGASWCLAFDGPYHLNLSKKKLHISFYKDGLPVNADKGQLDHLVRNLMAEDSRPKFASMDADLPIPEGTYKPLSDYYPVQNDFPVVYGIGRVGLPSTADDLRVSQAKQMKAFLMFFDQLLANYLAQLADVRKQLSVNAHVDRTYAIQSLCRKSNDPDRENFPNMEALFKDFIDGTGDDDPDDWESIHTKWDEFVDDPSNTYLENLEDITESQEQFRERRNRFLDHLIARFGENFTDYALLMYDFAGKASLKELIKDKEDFLSHYPRISRDRGKAFQYQCYPQEAADTWQKNNISGLRERLYKLLGIDDITRRKISYSKKEDVLSAFNFPVLSGDKRFALVIGSEEVLQSRDRYDSEEAALQAMHMVIRHAVHKERYSVRDNLRGFKLMDSDGHVLASYTRSTPFASVKKAWQQIQIIIDYIEEKYFREGMHILEHILLRPIKKQEQDISQKDIDEGFFPEASCNHDDCDCPVKDFYSFRMTVVLPSWPIRFRFMEFRKHVERIIRMETPAHILVKICWVSLEDMIELEEKYSAWLNGWPSHCCKYIETKGLRDQLSDKAEELIKKLNNLTNVYPEVVLFDCKNPIDKGAAILGRTTLGTFEEIDNDTTE